MADIRLVKPAAGASETVACEPSARFVFDFPATDATLARDGDDLTISFQDGSRLQLQDFYQEYNEENLPSFSVDGTDVTAADFFQAMNEPDLMPAAGPGTGTVANGARFHEWGDSSLTGGIQHLNGLDWGFSRSFEWEDHPNAVGYHDDEGGWDQASLLFGTPTITNPRVPADDPKNPGDPGTPPSGHQDPASAAFVPSTGNAHVVVDEAGLRNGSGLHTEHGVSGTNSFTVRIPASEGGVIELSAGGAALTATIGADGSLTDFAGGQFTANGVTLSHFHARPAGEGKWTVTYDYVLTANQRHDDPASEEQGFAQDADYTTNTVKFDNAAVNIRVTDGTGDVATSQINVEVHDDIPRFDQTGNGTPDTEYSSGKFGFDFVNKGLDHESFAKIMNQNDEGWINWDTVDGYKDGAPSHLQGDKTNVDFNMTASFMYYQYKDTGPDGGPLEVANVIDISSLIAKSGKALEMTDDGVAMGSGRADAWNSPNQEFSTGNRDGQAALPGQWNNKTVAQQNMLRELYGDDSLLNKDISAANVAEGIVFDLNDIAYGMDLNLGSFTSGDRVLVSFVMTAPYNDDNHVYKTVEINYQDLKPAGGGKFVPDTYGKNGEIEVLEDGLHLRVVAPDGFTKAFVSALGSGTYKVDGNGSNAELVPGSDGAVAQEQSGFTIRDVAFITPQWKSSGQVHASSADGIESYTLDTEAFMNAFPGGVYVKGMYAGVFKLTIDEKFENGEHVYTGTITGEPFNDEPNPYNGELFTFTIDRDGNWTYTQAKEFSLSADALDAVPPFTIVAKDGDGDTASYDLALNGEFARYHEVRFGQNDDSTDPTKDVNADTIIGRDGNSLIYGKGGHDLLAGDKINAEDPDETADSIGASIRAADNPAQLGEIAAGLEEYESKDTQGVHFGGEDLIYGGVGDDILLGMGGADRLYGEKGDDRLFGGSGNDYLDGGAGRDVLAGGTGDDILVGGNGDTELSQPVNANFAFLVDVSAGFNEEEVTSGLKAAFKQLIEQYADNSGEVNVLLYGFHSYGTQMISVKLSDADPYGKLERALDDITGYDADKMSQYEQDFYKDAQGGSNHALAINYAQGWFAQHDTGGENQIFMVSSNDPSYHVADAYVGNFTYGKESGKNTTVKNGNDFSYAAMNSISGYDSSHNWIELKGYTPGEIAYVKTTAGDTVGIINEAGAFELVGKWNVGTAVVRQPGDPVGVSGNNYEYKAKGEGAMLAVYNAEFGIWTLGYVAYAGDNAEATNYAGYLKDTIDGDATSRIVFVNGDIPDSYADAAVAKDTAAFDGISAQLPVPTYEGDTLLGGEGNDILFGDSVPDTLAGMDPKDISAAVSADPQKYAGDVDGDRAENDSLDGGKGDDILFGGAGNDELDGGEGDDMLFGGSGNDYLDGGAGNDYLDGGTGMDELYGGAGNDLIVYDAHDYLVNGGEGIDFLLAGKDTLDLDNLHLNDLLNNKEAGEKPMVEGVEVLLKGVDTAGLTSLHDLASKYGLELVKGEDGQERLQVTGGQWEKGATDGDVTIWTNAAQGVTMETTLTVSQAETEAVNAAKVASEAGGN